MVLFLVLLVPLHEVLQLVEDPAELRPIVLDDVVEDVRHVADRLELDHDRDRLHPDLKLLELFLLRLDQLQRLLLLDREQLEVVKPVTESVELSMTMSKGNRGYCCFLM